MSTKVKGIVHRSLIPGVYACGGKERDVGGSGTIANRNITCQGCRDWLADRVARAAKRRAGVA